MDGKRAPKAKEINSKKREENKDKANGWQPRPQSKGHKCKEARREQSKGEWIANAPPLIAASRMGKSRQVTEATGPATTPCAC